MKNLFILLALFSFSSSKAQGTITIDNYTPYTLYFVIHTELDNSCDYSLYGWNNTYPVGSEYIFALPAPVSPAFVNSVTYTSYLNTGSQTPGMTHFRTSDTDFPYSLMGANALFGPSGIVDTSHWAFLKITLSGAGNSFYGTVGVDPNCDSYPDYHTDGDFYAEIYTLSGDTYFMVYPI
jgi:hypothetical protein